MLLTWKCQNFEKGVKVEQLRTCDVETGARVFMNLDFIISDSYFHISTDVFQMPISCQVLLQALEKNNDYNRYYPYEAQLDSNK